MNLSDNKTVALIALGGVIFSAAISYIVSNHQASVSISNLETELESKYNVKLYEKRLEKYPELYEIVSHLGKDIRRIELPYSVLKDRLLELDEWDSKNAILLSQSSIELILEMRNILDGYTNFDQNYQPSKQVGREAREKIFKSALRLEEAIKKEIGIYNVKGYHNPILQKDYPKSWEQVQEK